MFFVLRSDYETKSNYEENEAVKDRPVTTTTAMASNSTRVNFLSIEVAEREDCQSETGDTCCRSCFENLYECLWMSVAVRCVGSAPNCCDGTGLCSFIDRVCISYFFQISWRNMLIS